MVICVINDIINVRQLNRFLKSPNFFFNRSFTEVERDAVPVSGVIKDNYTEEMRREETEEEKVRCRLTLDWWSSSRCPAGGNRWPPEGRPPSRPAAGEIGWTTAWCRAESWGRLRTASRRKSYVLSVTCDTDYPRQIMINELATSAREIDFVK